MIGIVLGFYRELKDSLLKRLESDNRRIEEVPYVIIDTELTGLDLKRDSIISIGAIKMAGTAIDLGKTFYALIRPKSDMKSESIVVHGITPSDLMHRPSVEEVIPRFLEFCGSDILVGHFVSLDRYFLRREIKNSMGSDFQNPFIDTYAIYRWIKENTGSFSRYIEKHENGTDLFSIAREYDIQVIEGHNALSDAFITAQIFQRFLKILSGLGVNKVKELLSIGRP